MAQRLRNGVVFLQGHDGEFTFLVKNGLLMETHMSSWSFEKTFKRSKLTHQTSRPSCCRHLSQRWTERNWAVHRAALPATYLSKMCFPITQRSVILNNAASLVTTRAEDRYKQNLRKLEIVPGIRRHGEQRRLTSLVPFGKIL